MATLIPYASGYAFQQAGLAARTALKLGAATSAVMGAIRHARKRYRKAGPVKSRKRSTAVVTKENRVRTTKSKHGMSKKKKNWIQFQKKVERAVRGELDLITLVEPYDVRNLVANPASAPMTQSPVTSINNTKQDLRLGCYGASNQGLRRFLIDIRDNMRINAISGVGSAIGLFDDFRETKFLLKRCKALVSMKNRHSASITIDVYECVTRTEINDTNLLNAQSAWVNALANTSTITAATAKTIASLQCTQFQAGATPFTCPKFGANWKVLKKSRIVVPSGEKVNYIYYGYKGNVDVENDLSDQSLSAGKCKDLIIILNPTFNSDGPVLDANYIDIETTKTYSMKWPDLQTKEAIAAYYNIT